MGDPQPDFDTVRVGLGERSYDVLVGSALLAAAGELIAARTGLKAVAIVTDENVARHQLRRLEAALARSEIKVRDVVSVPPGEASKSFAAYAQLCDDLLACGLERRDGVIALGGGVIGDLAGFAASTVRRGVSMVQVPTSLLAQVDSSVGGKTGINAPHGKNLVGAFYQPRLVLADIATLGTLPAREIAAGYAEVAKYGLLGDAAFFDWLETQRDAFAQLDASVLREAVRHSVQMKADIVARDETEAGERALLNLGHTFGHALEAWAGYDGTLLHGEAVAIGMCLAFAFSEDLGHAPPQSAARVAGHLKAAGLPTRIGHVNWKVRPTAEDLMTLMMQDKKVLGGRLTLILVRGIGQAFITRDVAGEDVAEFLRGRVATDA